MKRKQGMRLVAVGIALCALTPFEMGGCQSSVDAEARKKLFDRMGSASFTVYPTLIRRTEASYDAAAAAKIGDFFTAEKLGRVTLSADNVPVSGKWSHNQSKMFQESVDSLAAHLRAQPIQTEYAIMAEYLIGGNGVVGGLHCYIMTADGKLAGAVGLNSHHKIFKDADPKTVEDCTRVVIEGMREELLSPRSHS